LHGFISGEIKQKGTGQKQKRPKGRGDNGWPDRFTLLGNKTPEQTAHRKGHKKVHFGYSKVDAA